MKYIVRLAGKQLKPFTEDEVTKLIELGALHPCDYIFDPHNDEWIRPFDNGVFQVASSGFDEDTSFVKPTFHPPNVLVLNALKVQDGEGFDINKFRNEIRDLKSELEVQYNIVSQLQIQVSEKEEEISQLKWEAENETQEYADPEEVESLKAEIIKLHNEMDNLNEAKVEKDDMILSLQSNIEDYKTEIDALKFNNDNLERQLQEKDQQIEDYLNENAKIVEEFKSMAEANSSLKAKLGDYKSFINKERNINEQLRTKVTKLNQGVAVLKKKKEKDELHIKDLQKYKSIAQNKEKEELDQLIGDSYEVEDTPVWFIKLEDEDKGPFNFSDMLSFLKYKKISNDTPCKKKGEGDWVAVGKTFEFNTQLIIKNDIVDGKEKKRYFIQRSNFRAPFYDVAVADIGAKDYKGYCTSISVGGCFIELPKIDKARMEIGQQILVTIREGTLSEQINVRGIIRNISERRPRGLGIQFTNLTERQEEVILEFVNSYIKSSKKAA